LKKSQEAALIAEKELASSLEAKMAAFQKSGGKIQEISTGVSALSDKTVSKQFTISPKK
jgi:hypothetical protein